MQALCAKEVNEQTQRFLEFYENQDTQHHSEPDVSQIGKYLQREHHLTLSEEVITTTAKEGPGADAAPGLGAEFVAFDKDIQTHLIELERNPSRSNFEVFEDQFTGGSLLSVHELPRSDALHDRDVPRPHAFVMSSTPVPPEDEFPLLADLSVVFVTPRHFHNVLQTARGEGEFHQAARHDRRAPFTVDSLVFVES